MPEDREEYCENDLEVLFGEALDLHPEDRAVFLGRIGAEDAGVRQELEKLLDAASERTPSVLRLVGVKPVRVGSAAKRMVSVPLSLPEISMPERVGDYWVVRRLGQGGMGAVYEGINEALRRRVAIKGLHPRLAADPAAVARFLDEARAVNIIRHPGIVDIHSLGQLPGGAPYIVMEYLSGQPLSERLVWCGGRLGPVLLSFVRQIASALAAAHRKGIVHRDLKPDNVMIVNDSEMPSGERVKVVDFGVAGFAAELKLSADPDGFIVGTPIYMSPEQWYCNPVDGKADVYALGVVLYQLLVGNPPFLSPYMDDLMKLHLHASPEPLRRLDSFIPEPLSRLVNVMLAKDPAIRPAMADVAQAINDLDSPFNAPRKLPARRS